MRLSFGNLLANMVGKQFLRYFAAEVNKVVPNGSDNLVERTRVAAQALFDRQRQTLPDAQAQMIIGICSLVISGYRELVAETGSSQTAFNIVKATVGQLHRRLAKFMFRPLLWLSHDPVKTMAKINWKQWNQRIYGKSFEFDQETTSDRVTLIVNRCAFHQFFVEQGEPHLTQVICAWDRLWMDVIDTSKRPIRTERPTTISTGANYCQFHCLKDTAKAGKSKNDVILERQV